MPARSNPKTPVVHAMLRAHSVIFSLRSVTCALANSFLPPRGAAVARAAAVGLTIMAADAADVAFRTPGDDYRTTGSMPYWPGCSARRRRLHQLFYAYAQFGATALCLEDGRPFRSLDPCVAIQGAAFLMTLCRKGILTPYGFHCGYTLQLLYVIVVGVYYDDPNERNGERPLVTAALAFLARRAGANKYGIWLAFSASWFSASSTLSAFAAVCAATLVWQVFEEVKAASGTNDAP